MVRRSRVPWFAGAAALVLAIAGLGAAALGGDGEGERPRSRFEPSAVEMEPGTFDGVHRTVFHAVLEGLYEDGVSNEVADRLLAPDRPDDPSLLIRGCPICDPTRDALRVYRARPEWTDYKDPRDTFGKGLAADVAAELRSEDRDRRVAAFEKLVQRWVGDRLGLMRLTPSERERWSHALEERRKLGMSRKGERKSCPSCDGANGACGAE